MKEVAYKEIIRRTNKGVIVYVGRHLEKRKRYVV